MKITHIKIQNFRSIESASLELSDFNLFVGQNNSGKTNLFEAIEFFFNFRANGGKLDELRFNRDSDREIIVELTFSGAQHGMEKMQNAANKVKIKSVLDGHDIVTVRRSSSNANKRIVFVEGAEVSPGTGFDAALNDFLPKFEYVSTKQYYESVVKYSKSTPVGIMLSGVLTTILEGNEIYRQFQEKFRALFYDDESKIKREFENMGKNVKGYLEKQFPDCNEVIFSVSSPMFEDLLKNFETSIDDGIQTSAEEKGDGMQRALMLAIIQAYADFRKENEDQGRSFIFFIDEAELHLHPSAQRKLKDVLHKLSAHTDQVFINTHSSVFIADNYPGQSLYQVTKNSGITTIAQVSDFEKPYIVYDLLGGSPSDLLLPRNFLIVEGGSEFELLTRVVRRFYADKPAIQIIKANGDVEQIRRSINAIEKAFIPLNSSIYRDRLVILMDRPSASVKVGVEQFKTTYRHLIDNNQIYELAERDIEQCYPERNDADFGRWRKTQAEMDEVNARDEKRFDGKKKMRLAIHVGENITQQEFERELSVCYDALKKCWDCSFKLNNV